jgi:hypothetical protein
MSTRWLAVLAMMAALGLVTPTLTAKNGKAKGKGNPHVEKSFDDEGRGERGDRDDRWEHHNGYDYRVYRDRDGRPPGWSKGKKTGWGNCGLPPGQAKKYGCRTYVYQDRPHYYYEDDHGRMIDRRSTIHVHAGVDIVR